MPQPIRLLHRVRVPAGHPASIAHHPRGIWVADLETGSLVLVDPTTGGERERIRSVVRRPQTISFDGAHLWEYDEEGMSLYKRDLAGGPAVRFGQVPGVITPYLGFCHRENRLWLLGPDQPYFTVSTNRVWVIDFPRRIQAETYDSPTYSCRGLAHDGAYLWTLDVQYREVFCLDPATGEILTSYFLPACESPSSLVVTRDRIHTLDLKRGELLTYALDRDVLFSTSGGRRSKVDVVYRHYNPGPGTLEKMEFGQILPRPYVHQRLAAPPVVTPAPAETVAAQWDAGDEGEAILHEVGPLPPGAERELKVSLDLETVNLKFHLYPDRTGSLDDVPDAIRRRYLISELRKSDDAALRSIAGKADLLFQSGEKEIRAKVEEILDGEKNPFWIAKKFYNFVVDKVEYILPYTSISSRKILKQGKGSCGNHATIYIALCQVAGLPARSIIGFSIWRDDSRLGYLDHEIPEVYLPGYGWVPADTSRFMSLPVYGKHPLTKFRSFGTLSDRFFVNGFGRDMTSPYARRRYERERETLVTGIADPVENFYLRWYSDAIPTWTEFPARPDRA